MRQSFPILHTEQYKVGRNIIFLLCINIPCFPHQGGGGGCAFFLFSPLSYFNVSIFSCGVYLLIYLSLLSMTLKISWAFITMPMQFYWFRVGYWTGELLYDLLISCGVYWTDKIMSKFALLLEELHATQLLKLEEMGFFDIREHMSLGRYRGKCSCCSGATS